MRLDKNAIISFFLVISLPIAGLFYSFLKMNKKNAKLMIKNVTLFVLFFTITVPPFQDLYRRYLDTYFLYNDDTTYLEAFNGHVDFLFYAVSLFFKQHDIPFFYIPCIFSSLSVYLTLMSLYDLHCENRNEEIKLRLYKLSYFILFCFINILIIALGLRFGLAVALALRAVTINLSSHKKTVSYILFILSCATHFSMIFVLVIFLSSKTIKIKNYLVIPLSLTFSVFGGAILPYFLSKFNIFGISEYVTSGYVDGSLADSSNNTNAIIISSYNYFIIILFGYLHLTLPVSNKRFSNFINVFYVFTCLVIISFTAFNRYFVGVGTFFLLVRVLSTNVLNKISIRYLILFVAIFNLLFLNIYVQRRPIMLGHMWDGLYTPSIFRLTYSMSDFKAYLKYINIDGDWIGHEIRK